MINTEHLHDMMRARQAYRGIQLALYVLEHADDDGVYTAPSVAHLQRLLARPGIDLLDGEGGPAPLVEAKAVDVAHVIRQLISMGVLDERSEGKVLILAGGGGR